MGNTGTNIKYNKIYKIDYIYLCARACLSACVCVFFHYRKNIKKTHLGAAVAVRANIGTSGKWLLKDESLR